MELRNFEFNIRFEKMDTYEMIGDYKLNDRLETIPPIALEDWVVSIGSYLNQYFHDGSYFPIRQSEVLNLKNSLAKLKDGRNKRARAIQRKMFPTRIFFDHSGSESESLSMSPKRDELERLLDDSDFTVLELFFYHCFVDYSSLSNYDHVVKDAPYSGFALLWEGNGFLLG
ncbi:MAG: hypothetical protein KDK36_07455 [Leptospiraceae bacterium]|nr:hypothetical protein [Leptospiraceae bacterium]